MLVRVILIVILLGGNATFLLSQTPIKSDWIKKLISNEKLEFSAENVFLVELNNEEHCQLIRSVEWVVLRRLGGNQFIVKGLGNEDYSGYEKRLFEVNSKWKWDPSIFTLNKHKKVSFFVQIISTDNIEMTKLSEKYDLRKVNSTIYQGEGRLKDLDQLTKEPLIRYISLESADANEESRVIDLNLNPNSIKKLHHVWPEVKGEGVLIGIKERRFDPLDLDIKGRVIASELEDEELSTHATDMATIIAGAGNSFVTGFGVAPQAEITSTSFGNLFPDDLSSLNELNLHVQNHSYGTAIENIYGLSAQQYDQQVFENPDLVHVFSIGNSGLEVSESGPYAGVGNYGTITGNFKTAKNVITVGAVDSVGRPINFSSRGPTFDGRLKPDLSAYSMVGSSNAAALVSGTVGLLIQKYVEMFEEYPRADLIRALLLAGSEDLGHPGPDYDRGFGVLNAYNSMKLLESTSYSINTLQPGNRYSIPLRVDSKIDQVSIALTWLDAPSNPGDVRVLINDLNVFIVTPANDTIKSWVLSAEPSVSSLQSKAKRGVDSVNTSEMISFLPDVYGDYQLIISGDRLLSDQSFSLVYRLDSANMFEWIYPVDNANFPYNGETGTYFRWHSTLDRNHGALYYRYLNEAWQLIQTNVSLEKGYFRWDDAKLKPQGVVEAMMVVQEDTFLTDPFVISRGLDFQVEFNCSDSLMFSWAGDPLVGHYEIKQPGDQYLELLTTTLDTFYKTSKSENLYFNIRPVLSEGQAYLPTATFNYEQQGVGCFVQSFYHEAVNDEGISLKLELSSIYGIDSVLIEQVNYLGRKEVYRSTQVTKVLQFMDTEPIQGLNEHEVTLYFRNGRSITERATGTYYLTDQSLLVFPNPVLDKQVGFYTKELDEPANLIIYDLKGQTAFSQVLYSSREVVSLHDLRAGTYLYELVISGERYEGKLIIL